MYMPNEDIYWERVRESMQGDYEPEEITRYLYIDDNEKLDIEKDYEVDDIKELSPYDLKGSISRVEDSCSRGVAIPSMEN